MKKRGSRHDQHQKLLADLGRYILVEVSKGGGAAILQQLDRVATQLTAADGLLLSLSDRRLHLGRDEQLDLRSGDAPDRMIRAVFPSACEM